MHRNSLFIVMFSVASTVAIMPSAHAGVVTYTSSSSWSTAGPVAGTIDFSSLSNGNYPTPLTIAPVQFTALVGQSLGIQNLFGPGTGSFVYTLGAMLVTPLSGAGAVYGFGFNLGCYSCSGTQSPMVTFQDSSNTTYTYLPMSTPGYWGFRSDLAVTSITVSYGTDYVSLDDLSWGGPASSGGPGGTGDAPELATILLTGTGLLLMARYRRFAHWPPLS